MIRGFKALLLTIDAVFLKIMIVRMHICLAAFLNMFETWELLFIELQLCLSDFLCY